MTKKITKKVVKKVVKPVVKPKVKKVEKPIEPMVEPIVEPKVPAIKSESYCGIKILSISKREDGAYDVALANGTTCILDAEQYAQDVN